VGAGWGGGINSHRFAPLKPTPHLIRPGHRRHGALNGDLNGNRNNNFKCNGDCNDNSNGEFKSNRNCRYADFKSNGNCRYADFKSNRNDVAPPLNS
jgi:hypothetical protein